MNDFQKPQVTARPDSAIAGNSTWANRLRDEIVRVAKHSSSVLITGPTGTGKEMVAREIHAKSPRADKPFIPVDCGAIVESLFASHLFGHVKGAFTGAHYDAMGCFRLANGGTIFLDEIGELKPDIQIKLLRTLQERIVTPVGSFDPVPVDVRIVAATNRDLREEVEASAFREDLYYRLNVIRVTTTPLSQRIEDVNVLANLFLKQLAEGEGLPLKRLTFNAARVLEGYHWPGNVRQLRNVIERCVVYAESDEISATLALEQLNREQPERGLDYGIRPEFSAPSSESVRLPASVNPRDVVGAAGHDVPLNGGLKSDWLSLADLERFHIIQTLERVGYNQSAAARMLNISRRVFTGKIKSLGIVLKHFGRSL